MGETFLSLRALIEKWFTPSSLTRISRLTILSGSVRRCVRVESQDNDTAQVIFFFQHGDGVWRVYPPERSLANVSNFYAAAM